MSDRIFPLEAAAPLVPLFQPLFRVAWRVWVFRVLPPILKVDKIFGSRGVVILFEFGVVRKGFADICIYL